MNQVTKNLLRKNFNEWAIFSIINNTKINDKNVLGWKIIAGQKVTVEVIFHIIRKFRGEVIVRANGPKNKELLGNLATGSQKINFYLPEDMVLFQTEVKQIEPNGDVRVKLPKLFAQVDRRRDFRLFLGEGLKVQIDFQKFDHSQQQYQQKFNKNLFDISAGGSAFIISRSEKAFFRVNDLIKDINIRIEGREIKVNAVIMNILDVEPNKQNQLNYKGKKVCLRFLNLDATNKKFLEDFIFRYMDIDVVI
ncbi:MAG: PilZ domain-containing protein [Bacteriovoracaceae bacterium]|jgi:c-di-GMP-binding flagellar brake protein YcgR|nr:PilZ domain-containing protein [Bacteriovoracaceae bacterium]